MGNLQKLFPGNPAALPTARKMAVLPSKLSPNSTKINVIDLLLSARVGVVQEEDEGTGEIEIWW